MNDVISATCNNCGAKYDNLIKGVTPGSKITLYGCDKCVGLGEVEAKVVTVSGEPTKFVDKPSQDTVSVEDIMHATPKGREVVMKAIENSIEVQNKMTKKAQNTLKESNNLNTSEEHIKDTSLDVDWNDLIGQDMSAYEAKENIKILKKTIAAWHKQQQIKLIERIEGEVIGSKENYNFDNMERASVIYRNKLRAKQRQALKKIKESING